MKRRTSTSWKENGTLAIRAVLLGCALRRSELAALESKHIQQRDGRWVFNRPGGQGRSGSLSHQRSSLRSA
jgi:integrase